MSDWPYDRSVFGRDRYGIPPPTWRAMRVATNPAQSFVARSCMYLNSEQTSDAIGAVGAEQIGPNAIAVTAHLNKSCGVSYERVAEIFKQVLGLEVNRSTLARALLRLGQKAEPTYENLIEQIRKSAVVYPDETGWRIGGLKAWLWAVTTLTATVYLIERGRGFAEAAKILGEAYAGVIGSDGWAPYRRFTKAQA